MEAMDRERSCWGVRQRRAKNINAFGSRLHHKFVRQEEHVFRKPAGRSENLEKSVVDAVAFQVDVFEIERLVADGRGIPAKTDRNESASASQPLKLWRPVGSHFCGGIVGRQRPRAGFDRGPHHSDGLEAFVRVDLFIVCRRGIVRANRFCDFGDRRFGIRCRHIGFSLARLLTRILEQPRRRVL